MSAFDRQGPVAAAILSALAADAALSGVVGTRLYDAPPSRAVPPSVTIKLVGAPDASSADTDAQTLMFDLDVWDLYAPGANLDRSRAIMSNIRNILHMRALTLPGVAVVLVRCTGAQGPFRDPDGVTLHGVVTVAVLAGHESTLP